MILRVKFALTHLAALVGLLLVLFVGALSAEELPGVDMAEWQSLSSRAEDAVDAEDTSDDVLEELRGQLATYREQFNEARGVNATRIVSLRDQLACSGHCANW